MGGGSGTTLGLARQKTEAYELTGSTALHTILPDETLKLGPFTLEFIRVGHSVLDGVGIAIQSPLGRIIHTGDFKIGYGSVAGRATDLNKFAKFGEEGVLALLSDSTNVEREGHSISNKEISETLMRIITASSGRVIVALFASNIARIQVIVDIAKTGIWDAAFVLKEAVHRGVASAALALTTDVLVQHKKPEQAVEP